MDIQTEEHKARFHDHRECQEHQSKRTVQLLSSNCAQPLLSVLSSTSKEIHNRDPTTSIVFPWTSERSVFTRVLLSPGITDCETGKRDLFDSSHPKSGRNKRTDYDFNDDRKPENRRSGARRSRKKEFAESTHISRYGPSAPEQTTPPPGPVLRNQSSLLSLYMNHCLDLTSCRNFPTVTTLL